MPIEVIHIHLHLPEVLVGEFVSLEVDEHIATQEAVVENEVDAKVVVVEGEAFLAGFEEKPFPSSSRKDSSCDDGDSRSSSE